MKTVAMIAASIAVLSTMSIVTPTPAAAGWCIEACGLKRVVREPQTREVVCTTVRRGNYTETVCTRN